MEKYRFVVEQETEIVAIIENCGQVPKNAVISAIKDITNGEVCLPEKDIESILNFCNIAVKEYSIMSTLEKAIIISKTNKHWSIKQCE